MSFTVLFVGRRLINMCHKRDSLDKCVVISLKILDPGKEDVASLTPSTAAPGECAILSYFLFFFIRVTSLYL